ncbi:hypothetical protein [Stigmatella aurantiaca]|uniref:Uncharacterized protein n=1 Tax=Stigmatella aurantiaca (strain DW4/3-1) TaxID=378806 RepID=Q08MU1_STIAD|nr:hypothetical protein [Stigmatella aurantiaca]ADO74645.1 uncharacterized protein STAUR_6889 [Stigmatella aurantiaca DW4/3-1]EAU61799.1 hypothetical protein STIAU_8297 [Stigmatella aurantiaca DW4/3-1]
MSFASPVRLGVVLALSLVGCTQPQRPYTFKAPQGPESPIDTLVRALISAGHPPESVEPELGILHTRWESTGVCYTPTQKEGSLMRRFTTTVAPMASAGNTITVSMDAQCCEIRGENRHGDSWQGPCTVVSEILEMHQREVNSLGATLQRAMDDAAK